MEDLELLGPAERHIVEKIGEQVKKIHTVLTELAEDYASLQDVDWAEAMLDPKKKDMVIKFLEGFEILANRIGDQKLMAIMAQAVFKPEAMRTDAD